ncbi:hypothetical protein [Pseudorhodoplanes sp.]|uniref:hypothetical protein n=1 Tax=Pseudorhodoplanes sp. TaxID=1934341 RepID=UPI003D147C85
MSDIQPVNSNQTPTPSCPLCGGETFMAQVHAAVAKMTDVFRCKRCDVEYPVARKQGV